MDDFNVLAAMTEEPAYDNLVHFQFVDVFQQGPMPKRVFGLNRDIYLDMYIKDKNIILTVKNKRCNISLADIIRTNTFKINAVFSNYHRNTMAITSGRIMRVEEQYNNNILILTLSCDTLVKVTYSNTDEEFEYLTEVTCEQ